MVLLQGMKIEAGKSVRNGKYCIVRVRKREFNNEVHSYRREWSVICIRSDREWGGGLGLFGWFFFA